MATTTTTRDEIANETSRRLSAAAGGLKGYKALIGLDGFVDEIIAVVDKRHGFDSYEPIKTIADLGKKIAAAAGQSSNYELVTRQMKLGGNGPIMANALASFGVAVTYVGSLGFPSLHPVFAEMAGRARVISVADAGHTDALEFEDGKLMLGKVVQLNDLTWSNLIDRVGRETLTDMVDESALFGFVNWTMIPHMTDIWTKLRDEVLPKISKGRKRTFFVDLADPEKRTHADIHAALDLLTTYQGAFDVVLGLNLKESGEIQEVLGLPVPADPEASIEASARTIRERLGITCCVIHPRGGAAAATATASARFAGPFVQRPRISTGAGDHFNAGFALGQVLGFDLPQCLCTGVGTSGYYVRSGISPTAAQLAEFVGELPPPQ